MRSFESLDCEEISANLRRCSRPINRNDRKFAFPAKESVKRQNVFLSSFRLMKYAWGAAKKTFSEMKRRKKAAEPLREAWIRFWWERIKRPQVMQPAQRQLHISRLSHHMSRFATGVTKAEDMRGAFPPWKLSEGKIPPPPPLQLHWIHFSADSQLTARQQSIVKKHIVWL